MYDPPIEEGEEMAEDFSHIHLKSNNTAENDNERYGLGKLNATIYYPTVVQC